MSEGYARDGERRMGSENAKKDVDSTTKGPVWARKLSPSASMPDSPFLLAWTSGIMHFVEMDRWTCFRAWLIGGRFWAVFGHRKSNFTGRALSDRPSRRDEHGHGHTDGNQ